MDDSILLWLQQEDCGEKSSSGTSSNTLFAQLKQALSQVQQIAQKIQQLHYSSELEKKLAATCIEWLDRIREQENIEPNNCHPYSAQSNAHTPLERTKELSYQRTNRGLAFNLEPTLSMHCPTLVEESSTSSVKDSSNVDWSTLSRELTEFQSAVKYAPPPPPPSSRHKDTDSKDVDSQESKEASHAFPNSPVLSAQSHCGYERRKSGNSSRDYYIQTCPPHPRFSQSTLYHHSLGENSLTRRLSFTSTRIRNDENNITKLPLVEPLFVETRKELRNWLSWISQNIHKEEEWEKRVLALRKIRSLLLGGAAAANEMMTEFLKNIRWAIQKNINDRRSMVVRETCETIQLISIHVDSNTFEVLFHQFFDPLCRNCVNTIFVIASCADQCIRECLSNCLCLSFIPKLIQATESLHGVLRQKGFEWMSLILQLVTPQQLQLVHKPTRETYWVKLKRAIEKGTRDKLQQVRDEARKCDQSIQNLMNT